MQNQIAESSFSILNLVSLLGLIAMLGFAWLMSSHKSKVNWKLVGMGLGLQLLLAAILFQSQNWTFDRHFRTGTELVSAVSAGEISDGAFLTGVGRQKTQSIQIGTLSFASLGDLKESIATSSLSETQLSESIDVTLPRFENGILFAGVDSFFSSLTTYVEQGTDFVFRSHNVPPGNSTHPIVLLGTFAFGVLPTVIFFAALMSILYHIGLMERLIRRMAWVMQKTLGTSGAESLAAAANVLVGHTEAPLVVKPYIERMTRSELNALMVGGFATITGSLMAIFVGFGVSAGHILTASIISAPAALVIAKILQPEIDTPETLSSGTVKMEKTATNVIEAAAIGASDGMKLAINIAAMLIAFLALIAMADALFGALGNVVEFIVNLGRSAETQIDIEWSLNGLFSRLFYPLAFLMGIELQDCQTAGQLLGKKMVVNEFVAYLDFANIINAAPVPGENTPTLSDRSQIILTYALAGFSNFGAIGIQIGGIGPLAPSRRSDLAQLGLRAMLGGMLACCMTACIAGIMYGILR